VWTVEFAAAAERDFELIFDHLLASYQEFGDGFEIAFDRAEQRIGTIQSTARDLAKIPFQGTLRPDILPDIRFVRHDNAVFWFVAQEEQQIVQILGVVAWSMKRSERALPETDFRRYVRTWGGQVRSSG